MSDRKQLISILKIFGLVATLISIFFIIELLRVNLNKLQFKAQWVDVLFFGVLALFFYIVTQINAIVSWYIQLKDKYPEKPFSIYFHIIGISQIAKYLPGNVIHIAGRLAMAKQKKFKLKDTSASLVIETVLLIYPASAAGMVWLFGSGQRYLDINGNFVILLFAALTAFLWIYSSQYIQTKFSTVSKKKIIKILVINVISFISLGCCLYVIQFIFIDISYQQLQSLMVLTMAITLAFIAGFVMPGSPAGIGVREFVFVLIAAPYMTEVIALSLIISLRVINLMGDLLLFVFAWFYQRVKV